MRKYFIMKIAKHGSGFQGLRIGLKRKPLFSFSQKAKVSENSLALAKVFAKSFVCAKVFSKIFVFAKVLFENFRFCESFRETFLVPGMVFERNLPQKRKFFKVTFTSDSENFRENFHENEHFCKLFSRKRNSNFLLVFCEKRKNVFAKLSRKYELGNFRFNPKVGEEKCCSTGAA
jgi:hypothetical protein